MRHIFWLVPSVLAGRSGPSLDSWRLPEIRSAGIGAVLSVNDGELCHREDFEQLGMAYLCAPLSPNAPPEEGDAEHCQRVLPKAYEFCRFNASRGVATLVHCHAGKDRTGLFLAYYLVHSRGLAPSVAIKQVKAVRPIAFSAPGWEEFALAVLHTRGA